MIKCEHCSFVTKIFKNITNLHDLDAVVHKCSLGKRRDTCTETVRVKSVQKESVVTKQDGSTILSQEEIDKLIKE